LAIPPTFEATAGLVLLPSPVKQAGEEMSAMMAKGLLVADYEILLRSDGVLLKAVEEVRKLGTWPEEDLEDLAEISSLRKRMWIQVTITQKTAYGSTHSPVMRLRAQAGTPEQARDLAAAWATVAEELSVELSR